MATSTFTATLNGAQPSGSFAVQATGVSDLSGLAAAAGTAAATADTAAATATTDAAALLAYMGTIGLTGSLVASVTLTAAQGNSLSVAATLVSTDLATVKTDTAAVVADTTAVTGGTTADVTVVVNSDTAHAGTQSRLRHAFNGIVRAAAGSGFPL